MADTAPGDAEPKLPAELPRVGIVILAAAPEVDVRTDQKVSVAQARTAFLLNLLDAYANCGQYLREWECPPGDTWEVSPGLAEEIAEHAPGHAVLVNLGPAVSGTGRRDVWWSQDVELGLAKHLMRRRVAVSLVLVRAATKAEVIVYRGGRQFPGAQLIDLAPCLRHRNA